MLKCVLVFLVKSNVERFGHIKVRPNFVHMAVGSGFAAAIILSHFQLVQILDVSALVAIIFFNLLFVFLLFPLEGTLLRKLALLFAGNIVGTLMVSYPVIPQRSFYVLSEHRRIQDHNHSRQTYHRFCMDSVYMVT